MLWLVASLFFARITLGYRPQIISSLDQNEKSEGYPYGGSPTTTAQPYYPSTTTTQKPYYPTTTTQKPYYPPTTTTQKPYYPPTTTTQKPYYPPTTTTQTPYYPPPTTTTQKPYYPPPTTTTQKPYYPPTTTTQKPYYPPTRPPYGGGPTSGPVPTSTKKPQPPTPTPTSGPVPTPTKKPQPPTPTPTAKMANGFPVLTPRTRGLLEQCVIDNFISQEFQCGNNPYAGLLRLAFHDCATFDSTNASFPGGCNAWASIHCTEFNACEFTSVDNEGLTPWVLAIDTMYDTAILNGAPLSDILSRADFWHLAANRAITLSSNFSLDGLKYWAGRKDPRQLYSNPESFGPRFLGRIPQFFAFSEMERVAARNGMDNFHASALLGGHTLGHAHPTISGFRGSWDPTPTVFDNQYWKVLQGEDWFLTNVEAINEVTGEATNMTQYSLGGVNEKSSIQLFADVNQLVASTFASPCSHVKVFNPEPACPLEEPEIFDEPAPAVDVLKAWADTESTFFTAFEGAWNVLSQWGCNQNTSPRQCPPVDPFDGHKIQCGINAYRHKCKPIFKNVPPPWSFAAAHGPQGSVDNQDLINQEQALNDQKDTPPHP